MSNKIQRIDIYEDDRFDKEIDVCKLIDEFRFYSEHISNFHIVQNKFLL